MAARCLSGLTRRRSSHFAHPLATDFTDSRRRRFLADFIPALAIAGHVRLGKAARALGQGFDDVRAVEKRLGRHLGGEHGDVSPRADRLPSDAAALAHDDTSTVADTTDLAEDHAKKLQGPGTIHDGPDPEKRLAKGHALFEARVRVGRRRLPPLLIEPRGASSGSDRPGVPPGGALALAGEPAVVAAGQPAGAAAGAVGAVVREGVPEALGGGGRDARDRAAVPPGIVPGAASGGCWCRWRGRFTGGTRGVKTRTTRRGRPC